MPPIIFQNELRTAAPCASSNIAKFVRAVFRRLKHAGQHQLAQSHQHLIILISSRRYWSRVHGMAAGCTTANRPETAALGASRPCAYPKPCCRAEEGSAWFFRMRLNRLSSDSLVKLARHDRAALRPAAHGPGRLIFPRSTGGSIALRHVFPVQSLLNLLRGWLSLKLQPADPARRRSPSTATLFQPSCRSARRHS